MYPAPGAPAADLELASGLGDALLRVLRLGGRAKAEATAGRRDVVAVPLLTVLAESGPLRFTALAGAVFSDLSTVSRQVAQLVAAGYVERRPDPADKRASLLAITEAGRATLGEHRRRRDEVIAAVTAEWSPADVRRLTKLLDCLGADLAAHLNRCGAAAQRPTEPTAQEIA